MANKSNRILTVLTLAILALAITGTAAGNGNETLFILGTDTNEAALKNASLNDTITPELNVTIFTKNDTVPEGLNFSNYHVIFIESQNGTAIAGWDSNITIAKENGSRVIGYNLSAANATMPNVDLYSGNYTDIERYWVQGGDTNMESLLKFMGQEFCGAWENETIAEPLVLRPKINITYIMNYRTDNYYLNKVLSERNIITDRFNVTVMDGYEAAANLTDVSDQDVIMLGMISNQLPEFKGALLAAKDNGTQIGIIPMPDSYGVSTIDMDDLPHSTMKEYHVNSGCTNMENWIRCIGATLEDAYIEYSPAVPPTIPDHGIYHPDAFPRIFENSTEYLEWYADNGYNASAPTIGIIASYTIAKEKIYFTTDDAIIRNIESKGCNVLYTTHKVCRDDVEYFTRDGEVLVDSIISLSSFFLNNKNQELGVEYLKSYDIPVIKAVQDGLQTPDEYNASARGLNPSTIPHYVSSPEIDGCINYIWVAGAVPNPNNPKQTYYEPLMSQVDWLCDMSISWANLGRADNADKK